jgi:hypothetical protein
VDVPLFYRQVRKPIDALEYDSRGNHSELFGGARDVSRKSLFICRSRPVYAEQILQFRPSFRAYERLAAKSRPTLYDLTACRHRKKLILRILVIRPLQTRHAKALRGLRRLTPLEELDPVDA